MPKRVLLSLALLGLTALTSEALAQDGATHHAPRRRARIDAPAPRPRASATPKASDAKAKQAPVRKPPAEKAASIGSPNEGRLEGGVHVDMAKPYFRVVPSYESGDVRWGLPQLVNMLDRAARAVNKRYPGSVLHVGDLSKKGGGDLLRHHSHESGRDADIGFYALDARGKQIHGHGFVKFDAGMESPTNPGARYDLARNWLFVQELLTDPVAHVSHVFIAEPIRQRLLAYAKTRVSHALWDRAAIALMQPTQSLPHDDHFHVRISCPASMRAVCVELAKPLSRGKHRIARHKHPGGPGHHPPGHRADPMKGRAPLSPRKPPAAAGVTSQDPFELDPYDDRPYVEPDDDAHDVVDDSGTLKITD